MIDSTGVYEQMARDYVCDNPGCASIIRYDATDRALPFKGAFIRKDTHRNLRNEELYEEWRTGRLDVTFHCLECLIAGEKAAGTFTNTYSILTRYYMLDLSRLKRGNPYRWM